MVLKYIYIYKILYLEKAIYINFDRSHWTNGSKIIIRSITLKRIYIYFDRFYWTIEHCGIVLGLNLQKNGLPFKDHFKEKKKFERSGMPDNLVIK